MRDYLERGWDVLHNAPGEFESRSCRLCGSVMNCKRNVDGATSYAEAVGGGRHLHDEFVCPHWNENWHQQAKAIKKMILKCPSSRLSFMLEEELHGILFNRMVTKLMDDYED